MSAYAKIICAVGLVLLSAAPIYVAADAAADRKQAIQEFKAGRQLEKEKKFSQAIAHYKNALFFMPKYFWAHKQIGYCHYVSGNYDSAVDSYQRYLEANPKDDQTRYFLTKLRKQVYSGEINRRVAPKKTGRELKRTPFIGLGGGAVLVSDGDVKALYQNTWSSVSASGMIPAINLEAGYLFSSGFYGQVILFRGMRRRVSFSGPLAVSSSSKNLDITFKQSGLLLGGGWAKRLGSNGLLGFQLGAGPASIAGPGGTAGDSVNWAGEVRYDYLLGRQLSLGLRLGYMGARFDDFSLEHSGFIARLGLQWFLFPMRDLPLKAKRGIKLSGQD